MEAGTLKLVGVEEEDVYNETKKLLNDQSSYESMSIAQNPYGDGLASKRICENIKYYFDILTEAPAPFKTK